MTDEFVEMLIKRLQKDPELRRRLKEALFKEDETQIDPDKIRPNERTHWEDSPEATELRYRFMVR